MSLFVLPNYRSVKALQKGMDEGVTVIVVSGWPWPHNDRDMVTTVEGPAYPEVPQWRARVRVHEGHVVQVLER